MFILCSLQKRFQTTQKPRSEDLKIRPPASNATAVCTRAPSAEFSWFLNRCACTEVGESSGTLVAHIRVTDLDTRCDIIPTAVHTDEHSRARARSHTHHQRTRASLRT